MIHNNGAIKKASFCNAWWVAFIHSKKCWVVLTQFWDKYGQTQTLGLKFYFKKCNPMAGFVHIW